MYPLLEIKTVPIEIQMKIKDASLEYSRGTVEMEISHGQDGGVNVKAKAARVSLDSFGAGLAKQSGAPTPSPAAQRASSPSYEATAAYAQTGKLMINARLGDEASARIANAGSQQFQNGTPAPLPGAGAQESDQWGEASMEIRYAMDKLNFDWKIDKGDFKFTPGDIEISVEQRPDVLIKYVGGPIYVPRSSDPNYRPLDARA